jgi:CheY-like chemotaxis protein
MEAVGRLAGGIAHDFNNLLTVITGYSEMLLNSLAADGRPRAYAMEVLQAAEKASALTRQLLAFGKRQVSPPAAIALDPVVANLSNMLHRLIGEDIELLILPGAGAGAISADPGQVEQIVINLAVNARDAMPRGGRLTIETDSVTFDQVYAATHPQARAGDYVMLAVSDTGVGMNAAIKARIFDPLFTTKSPGKGTGLGLTTVKSILKQCGGHIEVYSEPGRGSSFKVYLPKVTEAEARRKRSNHDTPVLPRGHETVLLVEDEDCVRSLAKQVLEICGYNVLEACDGADALRRYERRTDSIDMLVSDVVMPFLDGRALADRLLAAKPHLKVLFVSGYPNDAIVRHGVLDSDATFLQKPFTTSALAQKVRQVLDQQQEVAA